MAQQQSYVLDQHKFSLDELSKQHNIQFSVENKNFVVEQAFPGGRVRETSGDMMFYRYSAVPLPRDFDVSKFPETKVSIKEGAFVYENSGDGIDHWHLNFAHSSLFVAWNSQLMAQDEHQILEHPILPAVRASLLSGSLGRHDLIPVTHSSSGCTPCLMTEVPRRFIVETVRSGLYGNNFSRASKEKVKAATTVLNPPTLSNILAIEAPTGGRGTYSSHVIKEILSTCYSGFYAAAEISRNRGRRAIVHTGHLGCGAYGGNKEIMSILQIFCAFLAGVELYYYTFSGSAEVVAGQKKIVELLQTSAGNSLTFVDMVEKCAYRWGYSDGN